jgi:hypothetical protein
MKRLLLTLLLLVILVSGTASAQGVDGYVSATVDVFPHVQFIGSEERTTTEFRARVFLERRFDVSERIRFTAAGFADGLIANRVNNQTTRDAIVRAQELHVEFAWAKADLRIGLSRVVWGKLDEFQPTDVVNPQDLTRFFFEGRSEGRMPVGMVRGRWLPSDRFTLEGVYVPYYRRGSFDQLDEPTAPLNFVPHGILVDESPRPVRSFGNAQGGARASVTSGRVDWSVAAYRGFEPLPLFEFDAGALDERYPRFTMVGGDFETVRGGWGIRGEVAAFPDRAIQAVNTAVVVDGRTIEAGFGADRKAGAYRIASNIVLSKRWIANKGLVTVPVVPVIDATDVLLVAVLDRSFARESRSVRVLGVYNPTEGSSFTRGIALFSVRDNVALETSIGWFTGGGASSLTLTDSFGQLDSRDFAYARVKVFF